MIPTWEQMHETILRQMNESEKTTGIRKVTKTDLAKKFGWATGQNVSYYIVKKYAPEFEGAGFVCVNAGRASGIYMKDDAEKAKNAPRIVSQTNVDSLIDRLDAPVEMKSVETLLAEQIRLQLDRNAQFADRILQITMVA